MKHHPNHRPAKARFSEADAERARQDIERQAATERAYQRLWIRFKRKRERKAAMAAGGGMERRAA